MHIRTIYHRTIKYDRFIDNYIDMNNHNCQYNIIHYDL